MDIKAARYTARLEDDFVVFLIGMRINKIAKVREWLPVLRTARAMVRELESMPDSPLLESRTLVSPDDARMLMFVQYWRSFDALESWAADKDFVHRPAQAEFFRRTAFNGNVGIFHETYRVRPGDYEAIYANMPATLLGRAGDYMPVSASRSARDRLDGV